MKIAIMMILETAVTFCIAKYMFNGSLIESYGIAVICGWLEGIRQTIISVLASKNAL